MIIIGLTGPTGSGKSTVAAVAETLGFAVIDCDKEARLATVPGSDGLLALCREFGDDILFEDGSLDRKKLAQKAFLSENTTEKLNKTLLPFILEIIKNRVEELKGKGVQRVMLDAPTLYESGADELCDAVIAVLSSEHIRRERIIKRDNLTEQQADTRLAASKADSFYLERTKHILYNNSGVEKFVAEATGLLQKLTDTENL